jgi:predicted Zn-dependent protease
MVNQLQRSYRRWFYPLISLVVAVSIWVGQPLASQAFSWADLLLRGIQVVQLSSLNDRQEIAQQINDEITGSQVRILRNSRVTDYVNQVGQRLAAKSDRPNLRYTFQVVDDNSINAFATMGGYVYVHSGLLKAADNEAQLASVMGHEIGHIAARHAIKQMREKSVAQGLLGAAGLDRSTAVNLGVQLALDLPNSRKDEYEADQRGLITLGRAGYAQSQMAAFMQKLVTGKASAPAFLSNHPAAAERVVRLRQLAQQNPTPGTDGLNSGDYRTRVQGA